jgi:hypothetical protein
MGIFMRLSGFIAAVKTITGVGLVSTASYNIGFLRGQKHILGELQSKPAQSPLLSQSVLPGNNPTPNIVFNQAGVVRPIDPSRIKQAPNPSWSEQHKAQKSISGGYNL